MNSRNNILARAIVFAVVLFLPACSVFSPVGDALGTGYENTVSYFNAYYNARRLYREAEEEILSAERLARGKEQAVSSASLVPASARTKLNQSIDKCSYILAFHPSSTLVDNALFLVGRSFFLLGDYLKAERKFTELLSQYPSSDFQLETQFWFAKCNERLNRLEETIQACDVLIPAAREAGEDRIETQTRLLKVSVLKRKRMFDQAAEELRAALETDPDGDITLQIHTLLGDVEFEAGRFEHASREYLIVSSEADDPFDGQYAHLRAAIALRNAGQFDNSITLLEGMADDFRYAEWLPSIKYELGNSLLAAGRTTDAIEMYRLVDTMQVRTDNSPKAALELGRLYERTIHNYADAQQSYARAVGVLSKPLADEARRKNEAFKRYFEAQKKLSALDSVYRFQLDTLARWTSDSISRFSMDSVSRSSMDSVSRSSIDSVSPSSTDTVSRASLDSVSRTSMPSVKSAPKPVVMHEDSVHRLRSVYQQEIADVFYSELQAPDSAVIWYDASMKEYMDSIRTPRVLYILAEIARSNPDQHFVPPDKRYETLIRTYPFSEYTRAVTQERAGLKSEQRDSAAVEYRRAEALIDSGKAEDALVRFQQIEKHYSASPYAAKSAFAIAWLYENRLHNPDSAVARYRQTTVTHSKTPYAQAAARRFVDVKPAVDSVRVDSTGRVLTSPADSAKVKIGPPQGLQPGVQKVPGRGANERLNEKPEPKKDRKPVEGIE